MMKSRKILISFFIIAIILIILNIQSFLFYYKEKSHLNENLKINKIFKENEIKINSIIEKNKNQIHMISNILNHHQGLDYLNKKLKSNQLMIKDIKVNHGQEYDTIHLKLIGTYFELIKFIHELSFEPNSINISTMILKNNDYSLEIKTKANDPDLFDEVSQKNKISIPILDRLKNNLQEKNYLNLNFSHVNLNNIIYSPFVLKKQDLVKKENIESMLYSKWIYEGRVMKKDKYLGVFLSSSNKITYFGLGMSFENSSWKVMEINQDYIILINKNKKKIRLNYQLKE